MQLNALIRQTRLLPSEYRLKRDRDLAYLMELKEENLLFPYYTEAGLNGRLNYRPEPCCTEGGTALSAKSEAPSPATG